MTTYAAEVNVIDGTIAVDVPDSEDTDIAPVDGHVMGTLARLAPWGEEEVSMDRADAALRELGWHRISEGWSDATLGGQYFSCLVVPLV
jgi:hypothetical protein